MNLSRVFILRPVATALLMVALLLAGLLAYRLLPVAALPEVDYPTIRVSSFYPGASPEVTASLITAPLERQFGQMPGLVRMSSSSGTGASVITLQFSLDLALDVAEQQVQAAINAAGSFLPRDLPMPPVYSKVNPADAPVVVLAVSSTAMSLPQLEDLVDTRLAMRLSQLPGVGLVSLGGGQRPAVRVRVDPELLARHGLSLEAVRQRIGNANVNMAKGSFDGPQRAATIDANDQLRSADEYRQLILAWKNGAALRLGDVASVIDGAENEQLAAWRGLKPAGVAADDASGHERPSQAATSSLSPAIIVNVQRQPGANVIDTVARIKQLLPQLQASLPPSVSLDLLIDRTVTVQASVRDVQHELLLAVLLVVAVIYVFLHDVRATLIPAVAVPLSLIGSFGVMYLAGFSINNLTLMALTIATGFVVDDAIVMIENIARHVEKGLPPLEAALNGAREIGFTIVSLTLSLIAVLIPLLFMEDVVGRLFREFAITLAVAILISMLISLTLTPMMCAYLLHARRDARARGVTSGRLAGWLQHAFERLVARYAQALDWVLARQMATLMVAALTLVVTVLLYLWVPKGFFPLQDTGLIQGVVDAPASLSHQALAQRQQQLAELILQEPAVVSVAVSLGVDGINASHNSARLLINLKPRNERQAAIGDIMQGLQARLARLPDLQLHLQPVQDLTIEDQLSRTRYQLSLQSPHNEELQAAARRLQAVLQARPELRGLASDAQNQGRQLYVDIDRASASRLGVAVSDISNTLYSAFGQRQISNIFTQTSLYRVILETEPMEERPAAERLAQLPLLSASGASIPLAAVARISEQSAPLVINRSAQFPAVTLSFDLAPGVALGQAVTAIEGVLADLELPASIDVRFLGAAQAYRDSLNGTLLLILAAVVTMYIVLGVLYESTIHPLTILSTLPSATVGALLALLLAGEDLGIIAIIGIILLIGIVKKNAIMMIDFALVAEREQGQTAQAAIRQACLLRFRPILMTTLAALFGALPLLLGGGTGSELRQPLGLTMVGGLLVSQVLTLFTTPVIYLAFDRLRPVLKPGLRGVRETPGPA